MVGCVEPQWWILDGYQSIYISPRNVDEKRLRKSCLTGNPLLEVKQTFAYRIFIFLSSLFLTLFADVHFQHSCRSPLGGLWSCSPFHGRVSSQPETPASYKKDEEWKIKAPKVLQLQKRGWSVSWRGDRPVLKGWCKYLCPVLMKSQQAKASVDRAQTISLDRKW